MAAIIKQYYDVTSTTTETDFAAASDVDTVLNVTLFGPTNWGEQVEYKLYAKRNPASAAVLRETIVLSGPVTLRWVTAEAVLDGWRVTHKKLAGSGSPSSSVEITGVQ